MDRSSRWERGFTLVELMIVLAIVTVLIGVSAVGVTKWMENSRVKSAARAVGDAFMVARAEAMRTGENHIVVLGVGSLANADADVVVAVDDAPASATCSFATSDILHRAHFEQGVGWGTTASLAANTAAPNDEGVATGNVSSGSSFTTAARDPSFPASWVSFQPDGIPRLFTTDGTSCTAVGLPGEGGGGIYVTNGVRDYAVVLAPLGTIRVMPWNPGVGSWLN